MSEKQKRNLSKAILLLLIVIILVSTTKILLSMKYIKNDFMFVDDESYFHIREEEYILKNWKPLIHDKLSYSGHELSFLPGFDYILALLRLFFNDYFLHNIILKFISSLIGLVVFLITYKITKNTIVSLFSSIASLIMPIYFAFTTQSVTPTNISFLLLFSFIYSFIQLREKPTKENTLLFMIILLITALTTQLFLVISISLLFYTLLLRLDGFRKLSVELEASVFSFIIGVFINIIFFKNAIVKNGWRVIIGNLPKQYLFDYLRIILHQPLLLLNSIGLLIVVLGVYSYYRYLFNKEAKKEYQIIYRYNYLFFAISTVAIILLLLNVLGLINGLILIGISLSISSGLAYHGILKGIKKTRFDKYIREFNILLFVLLLLSSFITINYTNQVLKNEIPREEVIDVMFFIRENTEKGSVVLAPIKLGNLITCLSKRKDVVDTLFLGVEDVDETLFNVRKVYTTISEVEALKIMNKYKVDYVIFTNKEPIYVNDKECFEKLYEKNKVSLYKVKCGIR